MNIAIGNRIKDLRTKKHVTQDRLATFLGVTPQAISRWEAGNGYPDIETLPSLADFFSVSTDDLLGYNRNERGERILQLNREIKSLSEFGTTKERIAFARNAVAQFPSDLRLQANLAVCLEMEMFEEEPDAGLPDILKEAESIFLTILENCTEDDIRYEVLYNLCDLYVKGFRDKKKAFDAANRLPMMKYCREFQKSYGLGDGNTEIYIQDEIGKLTDCLGTAIRKLVLSEDLPNEPSSWDRKIGMMETSSQIYRMIYGDDLKFYHIRLSFNYWIISRYQMLQGKTEEAISSVESMCRHAAAYDEAFRSSHGQYYTSPFVDKLVYPEPNENELERPESYYMLDRLEDKRYDPIREDERFEAVIKKLEEHIR